MANDWDDDVMEVIYEAVHDFGATEGQVRKVVEEALSNAREP